jgi:hypothetical protein
MANTFHSEVPDVVVYHSCSAAPQKMNVLNYRFMLNELGDAKPQHEEVLYQRNEKTHWTAYDMRPQHVSDEERR